MESKKLSISLPTDMARMLRRHVEEGGYASNSEVIRDALRMWQQREQERGQRLDAIRVSLDAAAADPVRHRAAEVTALFDGLLDEAEKAARS